MLVPKAKPISIINTQILLLFSGPYFDGMDISGIAKKLGLSEPKSIVRKAAELRRLADVQFNSSVIGVGEICKAIICLEISASGMDVIFDRQAAIKLSGMSEKAYIRSFNSMQNAIGIKNTIDVRELAIQFGCIRLIPFVHKGLSLYKNRFLSSLPPSRKASADFNRPVFTAAAFYLCAKRHKLKVDKIKLIELCGTSEAEFSSVSISMKDICFDVFGISKEKKDAREIKGKRDLLDVFPEKRRKTVAIHLMKRRLLHIKSAKEINSVVMKSGNQQFWVLRTRPKKKVLPKEPSKSSSAF